MYRTFSLLLVMVLALLACKTERLKESPVHSSVKPKDQGLTIKGRAYVGVADHGQVTIHPITSGEWSLEESLSGVLIDTHGNFSVDIKAQHVGAPAVLRLKLKEGERVRCTLIFGCPGQVRFGELLEVGQGGVELFVAIPELDLDQFYSITPFSHIAFRLVSEELERPQLHQNASYLVHARHAISKANTQVAGRFGLVDDLSTVQQVDITNVAELEQANTPMIRDSIIASAILQGSSIDPSDWGLQAIEVFAQQYVEEGLPGVSSSAQVISLASLLQAGREMAEEVQRRDNLDLSQIISELGVELDLVLLGEPDQHSRGVASETYLSTDIERGFEFVSDVRRVANSLDLHKIASLSSLEQITEGGAAELLRQFGIIDSTVLSGDGFRHIQTALTRVGEATLTALVDYYAHGVTGGLYEGLAFDHDYNSGFHQFTFATTIDACDGQVCSVDLNLNIEIQVDRFMGNASVRAFAARTVGLAVVGHLQSSGLELHFLEKEQQVELQRPRIESHSMVEGMWEKETYYVEGESIKVHFPLEFRKHESGTAETYRMLLNLSAGEHAVTFSHQDHLALEVDGSTTHISENLVYVEHLEALRFGLASAIKNRDNEEELGALNIVQSPVRSPKNIAMKTSTVQYCGVVANEAACEELSFDSVIEGETQDNYLGLSVAASFKSKLKGISGQATVGLTGSRDSPTANTIHRLKLSYPGHAVSIKGQFNNSGGISALSANNLDGMRFYFDNVNGKRRGALETAGKDRVADVVDMGQWIKILYANGDFESL